MYLRCTTLDLSRKKSLCYSRLVFSPLDKASKNFSFIIINHLPKPNTVEVDGEIVDTLPNTQFRIQLDTGQEIIGHLSGKMRVHRIRVMPGDRVRVEMSAYDLTKGRIILRLQ